MDYSTLSDSLNADELHGYFVGFLDEYEHMPKNTAALKQLYELAFRQWDTYEKLDDELSGRIEKYLFDAVNFRSYDNIDVILSITENLMLKNVFNYITNHKGSVTLPTVRMLIDEAEEEYGDSIDDLFDNFDDMF